MFFEEHSWGWDLLGYVQQGERLRDYGQVTFFNKTAVDQDNVSQFLINTLSPPVPCVVDALFVMGIAMKYPSPPLPKSNNTGVVVAPSGYTIQKVADGGVGTDVSGLQGVCGITVLTHIVTSTSEANSTVPTALTGCFNGTANMFQYRKNRDFWEITAISGRQDIPGVNWSCTMDEAMHFQPGDMIFAASAKNATTGLASAESITAAGITFNPQTERNESFNARVGGIYSDHVVTAGNATVVPTYTMLFSGSGAGNLEGATILLRLRCFSFV